MQYKVQTCSLLVARGKQQIFHGDRLIIIIIIIIIIMV
jgi:hypothetical protein